MRPLPRPGAAPWGLATGCTAVAVWLAASALRPGATTPDVVFRLEAGAALFAGGLLAAAAATFAVRRRPLDAVGVVLAAVAAANLVLPVLAGWAYRA